MAEEPQPDSIHEGASAQPPLHAEDRKAAAALSSLETQNDDEESAPTKAVDTEALGKAMKNLDVKDKPALAKEPGKKVKVDAADVTLLVGRDLCPELFKILYEMMVALGDSPVFWKLSANH